MAFDPKSFKAPTAKKLPVILLLDVSGSMEGTKINNLYDAVVDMVDSFVKEEIKETLIDVAIITFGNEIELHTPYTTVTELQKKGISKFVASGMTPMGKALEMAKAMIEDKYTTVSKIYKPAVILVSDGQPNDSWQSPLNKFITEGRSSKCQRFALAIGSDAEFDVLEKFTGDKNSVFFAEDARDIKESFKKFTMSVSVRAASATPNIIPTPSNASFDNNTKVDDDDDIF